MMMGIEVEPGVSIHIGVGASVMHNSQEVVSVVIPAFNEEDHIGVVLDVLLCVENLSRILVVDDGSIDRTCTVVEAYCRRDPRISLLALDHNLGKGGAMAAGAEFLQEDLILFLDADLIYLRPENVEALCAPVREGTCDMAYALFAHGRIHTDLSHRFAPFLSGQRCLRWSLFRDAPELGQARWGVEVALNLHAWHNGYTVQTVCWEGVSHSSRVEKLKGLKGYLSHLEMWLDIGRYYGRHFLFQDLLGRAQARSKKWQTGRHWVWGRKPRSFKSTIGKYRRFRIKE
jgi:polyisoprenyl-phosphate glycosyltransferase